MVSSVLPFSAMAFKNHRAVPANAARLEVLQGCARLLLIDIQREGYAAGLKVSVQVGANSDLSGRTAAVVASSDCLERQL